MFPKGYKPPTKVKVIEPFYFIVNDAVRGTKDEYCFRINVRTKPTKARVLREISIQYYSTLECLVSNLSKLTLFKVSETEKDNFIKRIIGITSKYKDGKLIVKVPSEVIFDKKDIEEITDSKAEEILEEVNDEAN